MREKSSLLSERTNNSIHARNLIFIQILINFLSTKIKNGVPKIYISKFNYYLSDDILLYCNYQRRKSVSQYILNKVSNRILMDKCGTNVIKKKIENFNRKSKILH